MPFLSKRYFLKPLALLFIFFSFSSFSYAAYVKHPVLLAAEEGDVACLEAQWPSWELSKDQLDLALFFACASDQAEAVSFLISHGADVNCDILDYTPLMVVAKKGYTAIARLLLVANANPNYVSNNWETPLGLAFKNGHLAVLDLIVRALLRLR